MKLSDGVLKYEERLVFALRDLWGTYGYKPFRMSRFEEYDLYAHNKSFLVSDSVITFTDTDGKLMALKPDVTLSIVKNCRPEEGCAVKAYYDENVFRVSGSTHSFREIRQAGLECIGRLGAASVGEVLSLAARSLLLVDSGCVLDVSHMGVVDAAIRALGVGAEKEAALLFALGAKNEHELTLLLDECGVDEKRREPLLTLVRTAGTPEEVLPRLLAAFADDARAMAAIAELSSVLGCLAGCPIAVRLDFSVIHDMRYYNGVVFRGFVPGVASGVLSGGQYDRLVRELGRAEGACGFALYLDLLEGRGSVPAADADVFLLYRESDEPAAVLRAAEELRRGGARVRIGTRLPREVTALQVVELGGDKA